MELCYHSQMKLSSSLDWLHVGKDLTHQLNLVPYNPDLIKMFNNIQSMVRQLSMNEVEARRSKSLKRLEPEIQKINDAIYHLEKLIFMANLMK